MRAFTVDLNINFAGRGILSLMFWPFAKWSWTCDSSAGGGDYSVLCLGPFHAEWFSHR